MPRNPAKLWIISSFATALIGVLWSQYDSTNGVAFVLTFAGWLSSLLAVGYYSTPSNSVFGKIAFGFVVLTVIGIAFKILHLTGADEIIVAGLVCILVTYVIMWSVKKKAT
ncbi:MAG TPA: hypothetical protein VGK59_07720 [Ohtaekwangia sp.]